MPNGQRLADALTTIKGQLETAFQVERAVRDRYNLLADRLRRKLKSELEASGIDAQMSECKQALELIVEKVVISEQQQRRNGEARKSKLATNRTEAEEIRKRAMEKLDTTQTVQLCFSSALRL